MLAASVLATHPDMSAPSSRALPEHLDTSRESTADATGIGRFPPIVGNRHIHLIYHRLKRTILKCFSIVSG